jgi:hypothetical protein
MTPEMKIIGDQMISAVKDHVTERLSPLMDTQRALLSRLDRAEQQLSALHKQLAALQRKGGSIN